MLEQTFYHNSIRRYIVAFGSLFNGIKIHRENREGEIINTIPVPLTFVDKEKFIQRINHIGSMTDDEIRVKEVLPAMGFELLGMNYSSIRKTSTMEKIKNKSGSKFSFNRVPYDFNFALYVGTRRVEDALRIIEQIIPYFTPELTVQMREIDAFPDHTQNVSINLTGVSENKDSSNTFNDRRAFVWELTFTLKGHLYTNVRDIKQIKKVIADMTDLDAARFYQGYITEIDPLSAQQLSDGQVKETVTDLPREAGVLNAHSGAVLNAELDT